MNVEDFIPGGIHLHDSKIIAKRFSDMGIDAIEISGGFMGISSYPKHFSKKEAEMDGGRAHFLKHAEVIKNLIDIPLIIVGGIRSLELSERILQQGSADYISMCRPFIREPNLINRWEAGDTRRSKCISCIQCLTKIIEGETTRCHQEKI